MQVFSFVEDVAASGGYWLACAGSKIYASKSSIIGRIGVISSGFGFHEAIEKLGIERRIYTEGKTKLVLNPFKPAKNSDIKIIRKIQQDIHYHYSTIKDRRAGRLTQNDDILFNREFWSAQTAVTGRRKRNQKCLANLYRLRETLLAHHTNLRQAKARLQIELAEEMKKTKFIREAEHISSKFPGKKLFDNFNF